MGSRPPSSPPITIGPGDPTRRPWVPRPRRTRRRSSTPPLLLDPPLAPRSPSLSSASDEEQTFALLDPLYSHSDLRNIKRPRRDPRVAPSASAPAQRAAEPRPPAAPAPRIPPRPIAIPPNAPSPPRLSSPAPFDDGSNFYDDMEFGGGGDDEEGIELEELEADAVQNPPRRSAEEVENDLAADIHDYLSCISANADGTFGEALCVRIDASVWVLEHWDGYTSPGKFVHVTAVSPQSIACDCHVSRVDGHHCLHWELFHRQWASLSLMVAVSPSLNPEYICIAGNYLSARYWVSVRKARDALGNDGKRTIVVWKGGDRWECRSCPRGKEHGVHCEHRARGRAAVARFGGAELDDVEDVVEEAERRDFDRMDELAPRDAAMDHAMTTNSAVSYKPIPPPPWGRLPSDTVPAIPPLRSDLLPAVFRLEPDSRCGTYACSGVFQSHLAIVERQCTVYTSSGVETRRIETQACRCRKKHKHTIGPDLASLALFNLNNSLIFAHEIFYNLLSQVNASPTPLVAFHLNIQRAYITHGSSLPFVSPKTFNNVFYMAERILVTAALVICIICGRYPKKIVCDGVANAIPQDRITNSLRPPTVPSTTVPPCVDVGPGRNLPFLPSHPLRNRLKKALRAVTATLDGTLLPVTVGDGEDEMMDGERGATEADREGIAAVADELEELGRRHANRHEAAAALAPILRQLADSSLSADRKTLDLYIAFLHQLGAHEPLLQFAPATLVPALLHFGQPGPHDPVEEDNEIQWFVSRCPSLAHICLRHCATGTTIPASLRALCLAIGDAVQANFDRLHTHDPPPPDWNFPVAESWRATGSSYSMPQIRPRPLYPRFINDGGGGGVVSNAPASVPEGEAQCGKFYNRYSKARHSGGIMAIWCTHSICYGFHFIPRAEGRNDVFSAIFVHWPVAPELVIYDFACALGPYCMSREAEYWKSTLFAIHQMHALDHKRCSKACFLSTYMAFDPEMKHVNSSAAECGNGGLGRIRKSVSYMTQEHAIAFCRVFLNIWNRHKSLRMEEAEAKLDANALTRKRRRNAA